MERILIEGLSFSLPLFIMAIGGIYSEKSGITNLALEGLKAPKPCSQIGRAHV